MNKISILMNCYNCSSYLKEALDSIYAQTYQNFEIIFVDNCSTDESAAIANRYDDRLKYFKTSKNIPLYEARNFGLSKVSGDFFTVLDADDYWLPGKLEFQISYCQKNNIDFLHTAYAVKLEDLDLKTKIRFFLYSYFLKVSSFCHFFTFEDLVRNYSINLQTVFFRSAMIGSLLFNPKLNHFGDADFFLRLLKRNQEKKFYYHSKVTSTSRIHGRQLSWKSAEVWLEEVLSTYHGFFKTECSPYEQNLFQYLINYYQAQIFFQQDKRKEGLEKLKSHRFHSLRCLMTYYRKLLWN